ncbi:hypothetical protein AGOR_G00008400 [Albula goreensis]|uniref:Myb-like domain-containing protein n=1 Tax=Albula goreensis TaxID=1534307 RepID=A0A8T3E5I7_9TELE|nr:hypothetical protein AGOR_G00008400 [Albula goreensis]
MMRRSRISVRPNVRPGSRAPNSSQDGPSTKAAADATQASTEEAVQPHNTETTQTGDQPAEVAQGPESVSPAAKEKGQSVQNSGGGDAPASVLQRRKRFSATPNLAKPRLTPSTTRVPARLPKSPPRKAATLPLAETLTPPSEDSTTSQGLRSPRWRRASGGVKPPKTQGKPAPLSATVPASGPAPQGKKEKEKPILPQSTKPSDPGKSSQEETPVPDPSPSCLVSSQGSKSEVKAPSTLAPAPPKLCSDRERIAKALKLRELLKEELRKQRKRKRTRSHVCEHSIPQDHNKMTMRDLIYYLPESNPMKSFPVEESRPAEKVSPASASKELPEKPRESQVQAEDREGEQDDEDEEAAQEDQLVVPRVKVAEDGTLILDEESLTVEVLRTKGPNLAAENDPIFERGSSTTYSSFRKAVYTKPWSNKETEMFFLAISMVGTDFSMIGQLFPHRARSEIKNKFKKEEKENSWRIDKAFKEKCRFDLEFFSSLLERILAEEELKRKKSKPRNSEGTKKKTSKHKGTRSDGRRVSRDHSSEEELDSDIVEGDSETAEKENEDCSNVVELGADTTATRSNLKRKTWEEEIPREKTTDGRNMQKNRPTCEEDENVLSEDHEGCVSEASDEDRLKRPESSIQGKGGPKIKPAQLSRGRLQRPTPNLTGRGSKKAPQARQKSGEEMDGDEDCSSKDVAEAGAPEGKRCRREMKHGDGVTSAEELEETDPPAMQEQKQNKPSRRIARIPQQQKQPGKEDSTSASSSQSKGVATKGQGKQPTGPGKRAKPKPNLTAGQRNGRTGKSKLVTLRASQPEDNEEEEQDEAQPEEDFRYPINPEEQNQAPAFVPLSLRSPQPVSVEVVETMEELEISVNVPDVVGTAETEHALCSQPVCPGPQDEVVVPAEHQLDLLVDVIEFLSPENAAGSEESYNEAARTLLTIRNPELLSLAPPGYSTEVVIADESPHIELEESELSEKLTSEPADQLQCSSEDTQTVNSDLTIIEASQSVSQPDPDRDSMVLIPAAESKSLPPVEASTFMATDRTV